MQKRKLTDFGEEVKNRLYELNMTQKTLAKKIGTSEAYLSMILYGERSGAKYKDKIKSIIYTLLYENTNR
ncbi:MAG: helix-turn-helix domain-containing protein [Natronincolaceae bacterium]|mgnify:CR=1 FL=1